MQGSPQRLSPWRSLGEILAKKLAAVLFTWCRAPANAFFYFAATMLLVTLTPWTYYTVKRIVWPKPPEEINFDSAGTRARRVLCG